MAAKRTPTRTSPRASTALKTTPRRPATGPALRTAARSRFILYNLLGKEQACYSVERHELHPPVEPWLKTELVDRSNHVRVASFDINHNTANLNILNLGKFPPANKFLDRMYEVLDETGRRINRPTCEDCLGNVTIRHKELSPRTRITPVDEFMRPLFDDFLGVAPNGAATAVLKQVGAGDLARMITDRGRGKQPDRAAFVAALTNARKALDAASDALFNDRVSPLVFYIGSTGTLLDEIDAKAQTAEQITAKYPELNLSRDEQDGLFFEVGESIVSVYARTEFFSRESAVPAEA
jgi:hypothetical protein